MKALALVSALALFGILGFLAYEEAKAPASVTPIEDSTGIDSEQTGEMNQDRDDESETQDEQGEVDLPDIEVVVEGLEIPWDIAFLPGGSMLVTERPGHVVHIESGKIFPIEGVAHTGEGGLLGIALHPDFETNSFVYLYQTSESAAGLVNRVTRYTYEEDELALDRVILDNIPGARYHDGGRIEFGPDGMLYIAVGDATSEAAAQNTASIAGAILRVTDMGEVPENNPFGNEVYSYGHRNPQGLAWDSEGRLWSTEHGPSGLTSGDDEINHIIAGGNYGWPESRGDEVRAGTQAPVLHSTKSVTWAPASALYHDGSLYFGGLRGRTLYEAVLDGTEVVELKEHFKNEYGRIRTVRLGPDGYLYITTSNRDGRGDAESTDDRIIRINPDIL